MEPFTMIYSSIEFTNCSITFLTIDISSWDLLCGLGDTFCSVWLKKFNLKLKEHRLFFPCGDINLAHVRLMCMNTQWYSNMIGQWNLLNPRLAYSNKIHKNTIESWYFRAFERSYECLNQRCAGTAFKHMVCVMMNKDRTCMGTKWTHSLA